MNRDKLRIVARVTSLTASVGSGMILSAVVGGIVKAGRNPLEKTVMAIGSIGLSIAVGNAVEKATYETIMQVFNGA